MKVLILSNDRSISNLLEEVLQQQGHDPTIFDDSQVAWQNYQQELYPLVIIDLKSAPRDRLQLCRQMRALPQGDFSVIMAITANSDPTNLQAILDAGANDYSIEPLDLATLNLRLTVIEKQLRYRGPIQQLVSHILPDTLKNRQKPLCEMSESQQHYIILDRNLKIAEVSSNLHKLANFCEQIVQGKDIREVLPELIGIEDRLSNILSGEQNSFNLPGIARYLDESYPLYFDLSIARYSSEIKNDPRLIILLNNSTDKMILQQILTQRVNESQLLLRQITAKQTYINKLISSLKDALLVTDEKGTIKQINLATVELFGYSESELLGRSIALLIEDREFLEKSLQENSFSQAEFICQKKTGEEFYVSFSCAAIETEDDARNFIYTGRDITERHHSLAKIKKLNDSLQQRSAELELANEELEAFAHTVSHDLRTPLNHVNLFNYLLLEEYEKQLDNTAKNYIQQIKKACSRMAQLIEDLLQLAKLKRREIKFTSINLSSLVQSIALEIKAKTPERKADLIIAPNVMVLGDARLLQIVLENLIGNAWKYTRNREIARIEFGILANSTEQSLLVTTEDEESEESHEEPIYFIRDNGVGFNMENANQLFKPFGRLHSQNEFEGTGIGLTTVQRIIQRHNGSIWAEGSIDRGATFYFTLPTSTYE